MATVYVDWEAGSDANTGASFAQRLKHVPAATKVAPGDTVRFMASPNPTDLGINATWTNGSRTVTLASALTKTVTDFDSGGVASANVTVTHPTTSPLPRTGTASMRMAVAGAFTTGKIAYIDLGSSQDFSAYQQLSFWFYYNGGTIPASTFQLKLCSDATGDTPVDTLDMPAIYGSSVWHPITLNKGSALGASIRSVAIYATVDPGTPTFQIDHLIACKAPGNDSLSLTSLLGKVHTKVWQASTAYSLNDIRRPTAASRNGYSYKVTTAGTSGATQPSWPRRIGATVIDGTVTWTCDGLEETWWAIRKIDGTAIELDSSAFGGAGTGRGYVGVSETVAARKREPIQDSTADRYWFSLAEGGSVSARVTYSGGWNRTDMSTQDDEGETWFRHTINSSFREPFYGSSSVFQYVTIENFGFAQVKTNTVWNVTPPATGCIIRNCHFAALSFKFLEFSFSNGGMPVTFDGMIVAGADSQSVNVGIFHLSGYRSGSMGFRAVGLYSNTTGSGYRLTNEDGINEGTTFVDVHARNNSVYGFSWEGAPKERRMVGLYTEGNASGGMYCRYGSPPPLYDSKFDESTKFAPLTAFSNVTFASIRNGRTADAHLITTDGGTIASATDQRHTASGISWKFNPTSTNRGPGYPLRLPLGKIAVAASGLVTVKIWARRDSTNIAGKLVAVGRSCPGLDDDASVTFSPAINTWTEYTLTFTPTEAGVVDLEVQAWDGTGTTNSLWVDDLTVTQA